jgi:LEA14-like dessication related protein
MRYSIALATLIIAAACASGTSISQKAAHIPLPDIIIIGRTDLTDVPALPSGVAVHFEFRITNQADIPITLRHIDLVSLGGGGINIESKNRPYNTVIQPHTAQSVDFVTTALINDPTSFSGRSPVQIRATALFDSADGSLQKIAQQQVRPEGSY